MPSLRLGRPSRPVFGTGIVILLLLFCFNANATRATSVWTSEFVAHGPAELWVQSAQQVTVDSSGTATAAHYYSIDPKDPTRHALIIARTDHCDDHYIHDDAANRSFSDIHLRSVGSRTFMVANVLREGAANYSCRFFEIGTEAVLSETQLFSGPNQWCLGLEASFDRLFVITSNRQVMVLGLDGQILATTPSLGPGFLYSRQTALAANGDLLLAGWVDGSQPGLELTRISPSGEVVWQVIEPGISQTESYVLNEHIDGRINVLHLNNGQAGLALFEANGMFLEQTLSPVISNVTGDLCLIGDNAYILASGANVLRIHRFTRQTGLNTIVSVNVPFTAYRGNMKCAADSIMAVGYSSDHLATLNVHPVETATTTYSFSALPVHDVWLAEKNGRFAALQTAKLPLAAEVASLELRGILGNGSVDGYSSVYEVPLEPNVMMLKGSGRSEAVLATKADNAITVHDVASSGWQWSDLVRVDGYQIVADLSHRKDIQIAKLEDGRVDVLSGNQIWQLIRYDAQGSEYARIPIRDYDYWAPFTEMHHLPGGQVLVMTERYASMIDGPSIWRANRAALSVNGRDPSSIRLMWHDNGLRDFGPDVPPSTNHAQVNAQLQVIPATSMAFPELIPYWTVHPNGVADHIPLSSGLNSVHVMRVNAQGGLVFEQNVPVPGLLGDIVADASDAELGIVMAFSRSSAPQTESVLVWVGPTGQLVRSQSLPFRVEAMDIDQRGSIGVLGRNGAGQFLRILDPDGNEIHRIDCADRATCARAPQAIDFANERWFVAGKSRPLPGSAIGQTFVQEISFPLFRDSFED